MSKRKKSKKNGYQKKQSAKQNRGIGTVTSNIANIPLRQLERRIKNGETFYVAAFGEVMKTGKLRKDVKFVELTPSKVKGTCISTVHDGQNVLNVLLADENHLDGWVVSIADVSKLRGKAVIDTKSVPGSILVYSAANTMGDVMITVSDHMMNARETLEDVGATSLAKFEDILNAVFNKEGVVGVFHSLMKLQKIMVKA